jgi:hypothetical protein
VVKEGKYPANAELAEWFGIIVEELAEKKPKVSKKLDLI